MNPEMYAGYLKTIQKQIVKKEHHEVKIFTTDIIGFYQKLLRIVV